jgi:ferredoxin/flavodoxin
MTIFYFTGTGNSLDTAKKIAAELGGCRTVSIKKALAESIKPDDGEIGLVFPVYAYGPPRMVQEFIRKADFTPDQYIFSVLVCGGTPGKAAGLLGRIIRKSGGKLSTGFVLRSETHRFHDKGPTGLIKFMKNIAGKQNFGFWENRKEDIISTVKERKTASFDKSSPAANFLGSRLAGIAGKIFMKTSDNYFTGEECTSCGTCVKICPRGNITLQNGKPAFGQNCEACSACIQFCPEKAIHVRDLSVPGMRSHNANVSLKEMTG